jgi:tetratricopeptide (TPR) repeat protein
MVCLFLALAVWAVFGQTLRYGFVNYDDNVYVYDNPAITQGYSLHGVAWIFTHVNGPDEWMPLTAISHMLDCQLYGLHPGGHHLTNVLLHALTAILLFLVLRNMTGKFWPAAFVAAVFAIHPLRVESVAWVTERKDVLSGLFFMLTLWAYARFVGTAGGQRLKASVFYWLAVVFFALGLMSKPMLVTLPFVLLLLDYWPLNRLSPGASGAPRSRFQAWLDLFVEKIPFLLLSAAACVVTLLVQRNAIGSVQAFDFPSRIENALVSYVAYLWQMLYPAGLAVFYPHPRNHLSLAKVGLSLLLLFLISAGVVAGRRKHPCLLVGWLWYLGMLVPVLGLLQVGEQARADRYTYLPQIGLYVLVAWGVMELCGNWRHRRAVLGFAAMTILAALLAGAYIQTGYWKDSASLWTHALACTSENYLAHNNLGLALAGQGKPAEAIEHYERALQFMPDYAKAHNNLGVALAGQGRLTEATQQYERALQLKPDSAEVHNNLGIALAGQGGLARAIEHYERALQLKPDYAEAHNNLGVALAGAGRPAEAIEHYGRALQLRPDYAEACYNLGNALAGEGRLNEAIEHYERALQLKPDNAGAHNNLGLALAREGRLTEAVEQYERVLQLKPDSAEPWYNLGKVLDQQGKLSEAALYFQQALTLATAQGNTSMAEAIHIKLKSYPPALLQPRAP